MKYLSVRQTAEKWGISSTMVRRYCVQGRIPKATQKEDGWKIPENAKKPTGEPATTNKKKEYSPLAKKLLKQKTKKSYHGLYDYVVINLTYSSCRMASNRLTRKQVEMIFRKGKVDDMFEAVKVSDMVEALNHCVCVDYILAHLDEPLSPKSIKALHKLLTYGTVDARVERVAPGEFRTVSSKRKESFIEAAKDISGKLKQLTAEYEALEGKEIEDVLDFHVQFEKIFPFEDCNGRVGRLIMFKECLRNNITPFIIDDKRRSKYLAGLRAWPQEKEILLALINEVQQAFADQVVRYNLLEKGIRFSPISYEE